MPSPVEKAVDTYIRASRERDAAAREALLESCFAADGRVVMPSRTLRGRAAVADEIARFLADPRVRGFRVISAIDAGTSTYRFRTEADFRDGTSREFLDVGEVDATGRIALILVFSGPLRDADES